jgi:hypothetical protein
MMHIIKTGTSIPAGIANIPQCLVILDINAVIASIIIIIVIHIYQTYTVLP